MFEAVNETRRAARLATAHQREPPGISRTAFIRFADLNIIG